VGLIVNELATNSLRHAFPDNRAGKVVITLRTRPPGEAVVEVADDGIGQDQQEPHNGFGYALVQGLAQELRGKVVVETQEGTRTEISFPLANQ
jgi:two-component sensor histidine kinase